MNGALAKYHVLFKTMISALATSKRRKLAQVGTLYRSSRKSKLPKTKEHRRMRRQGRKRNLSMKNYKLLKHAVSSILFTRPGHKWKNLPTAPETKEQRRMRRQRKKRNLSMKNYKLLKHAVSSILFTRPGHKWKNLPTAPETKEQRRMRRQRKKRNLSMKNYKLLKHAVSLILFTRLEHKRNNLRTSPVFLLHTDLNQRKSLMRSLDNVTVKGAVSQQSSSFV